MAARLTTTSFLIISLSLAFFPFGVAAQETINPTSTEPLEGDVDEGEVIIPIEEATGEHTEVPSYLVYENSDIPIVLPRSTWENSESLEKLLRWLPESGHEPPDYHPLERIVVHDLGCPTTSSTCNNDDTDPVAIIQSIYRFHSVTRGWGDIGYNYIIDRKGRIYEGRYGGNGVRGAHVYHDRNCENYNAGSVGIMLIGNYSSSPIPEVMQRSLERLVAWIATTNTLDLSATVTTAIWKNPKVGSFCDVSGGGFNSSFTGPVLLSHGDIEQGNSDIFDLSQINRNALLLLEGASLYVYNIENEVDIYQIKDGMRISYSDEIAAEEDLNSLIPEESIPIETSPTSTVETLPTSTEGVIEGNTPQLPELLAINENQLLAFPAEIVPDYAENTILRSLTRSLTFLIENGVRKKIISSAILDSRGLNLASAISVTDRELASYPYRGLLGFSEGSLVADQNTGSVYVVEENMLRHITSAALFNTLNFIWNYINPVSSEELKVHTVGDPLLFPDGILITGSDPRVWLVDNQDRRHIASARLFGVLGFRWDEIQQLEDYEVERYDEGLFVFWPDGTLIRGEETEEVYLVKDGGNKEWIPSAEEFITQGYKWENIVVITQEELTDYPLVGINPAMVPEEPEATPEEVVEETPEDVVSPAEEEQTVPGAGNLGPNIRIALYSLSPGDQIIIGSVGGTFRVLHNGNLILGTSSPDEEFVIRYNELNPLGVVRFEPMGEGTILEIVSYEDRPSWNLTINDNLFRGAIEIEYSQKSQKFWVVNELPIEEYLKGVAETLNGDPPEYGKAFAIASRSYALYHLNRGGKREGEPYHLNNTSSDQVYKGYGFEQRAYDPVAYIELTTGQVATYNGEIIVAAYSSGAPGVTLSACDLGWTGFCGAEFDYLDGGVSDPVETEYGYTSCGGANHCVGIDAAGAREMASLGKTYEEILKWYYPGINLEKKW